jgi:hypothetical protein
VSAPVDVLASLDAEIERARIAVAVGHADGYLLAECEEVRAAVAESHAALCVGYLLALQLPDSALRIRNQRALCQMRDAIAKFENRDQQAVQEEYEERALMARCGAAQ